MWYFLLYLIKKETPVARGTYLLKVLREEGFSGVAQTAAFGEEGLALKVSLLCRLRGRFALLPSGFRVPPLCFVSQLLTRPGWALFFPLSHFPAMFWTAFSQTSFSPWGIVSARWVRLDDSSHSQRLAAGVLKRHSGNWLGRYLDLPSPPSCSPPATPLPPRRALSVVVPPPAAGRPELKLPWQLALCVSLAARHFLFFYLSECMGGKPLSPPLWNCKKEIKWPIRWAGFPCDPDGEAIQNPVPLLARQAEKELPSEEPGAWAWRRKARPLPATLSWDWRQPRWPWKTFKAFFVAS